MMEFLKEEEAKQLYVYKHIHSLGKKIAHLQNESVRLRRIATILAKKNDKQEDMVVTTKKATKTVITKKNYATSDIVELLEEAHKKFVLFDLNKNGILEPDEILLLADWVWNTFQPNGRVLRKAERVKLSQNLLKRCDKNQDGKIDFDEFAEWFVIMVNNLKRADPSKKNYMRQITSSSGDGKDSTNDEFVDEMKRMANGGSPETTPKRHNLKVLTPRTPNNSPHNSKSNSQQNTPETKLIRPKSPMGRRHLKRKDKPRLARNRVQLFLRLDRSNDKTLTQSDVAPMIGKCGYGSKEKIIYHRFCQYFNCTVESGVGFIKFTKKLPAKANEQDLCKIIHKLAMQQTNV